MSFEFPSTGERGRELYFIVRVTVCLQRIRDFKSPVSTCLVTLLELGRNNVGVEKL
jgi:hypothetical protein